VKEEAQRQMANNEFRGVDSLDSVPDEIGDLFVTTGDLSAKQHADVQCALQDGVDSAISKTVNAPSDATPEDAADAFLRVYNNGGKGITYYRDGTRSKQVLTTRENNQETKDPVEVVQEKLEEGDIQLSDLGVEQSTEQADTEIGVQEDDLFDTQVDPMRRPKSLNGKTKEVTTGYGDLFVTINEVENGEPFEVFANIGKSGGYTESFTEATARLISLCLRCGIDPEDIVEQIEGIRSPKVSWDEGDQVFSVPDGIAIAMRRYLTESNGNLTNRESNTVASDDQVPETDDSPEIDVIDAGENPECPECGSLTLYYSEGCKKCESCGWSEC
jgi:ribonucleoside-diphosphate reductase alpha chain